MHGGGVDGDSTGPAGTLRWRAWQWRGGRSDGCTHGRGPAGLPPAAVRGRGATRSGAQPLLCADCRVQIPSLT